MAVMANVNDPKKINEVDPKATPKPVDEGVQALENDVKKARARRELVQENKLTDDLMNPPQPPEPAFKVTGGVNLGMIDMQEQQRLQREENEKVRRESQARIEKLEKDAADAREALNKANLDHMQQTLGGQLLELKTAISSGNKHDIMQELTAVETLATKLGFSKTPPVAFDSGSFTAQLELKRLDQEMKREDRRFQLEMKRDERMWQLELQKLDAARADSAAKLEAEKRRWETIAAIPEQLGGAVAQGLISRNAGAKTEQKVAAQPEPEQPPIPVGAEPNAAAQFECPVCKSIVGLGPTSKTAVCARCGQKFVIHRQPAPESVKQKQPTLQKTPPPAPQEPPAGLKDEANPDNEEET